MKVLSLPMALVFFIIQAQPPSESIKPSKYVFDLAMAVTDGDKVRLEEVSLRLSEEALVIEARCHCAIIKEFEYSDIKAIKYSPAQYRLAVETDDDHATLKMDENNYKTILAALEARRIKVETIKQ